jgi:hypothetical protein
LKQQNKIASVRKDNEKFYSNGKLLITENILFLMAPKLLHYQQKGQNLIIEDGNHNEIISGKL